MIKKIKSNLFAKVFILTAALLLCVCLLVFGILAWIMPNTYSTALNDVTDKKVLSFISEVEQSSEQNSGTMFDQFVQGSDIVKIELYDGTGVQIPPPTSELSDETQSKNRPMEAIAAEDENIPTLSNRYYFSFADSNDRYMLIVYTEATQVAELEKAFKEISPLLLLATLTIALLSSWFYSRIITKPVLKISGISQKMSDLQLEWHIKEERSDELGVLEKSLNSLSHNLSFALSELQTANKKLERDIVLEKELEQARLDFFAAASHELKTPITVIKGQLEGMILGVGAYKDHEKYLTRSLEVANILENLVQEILTISRLEKQNANANTERFDAALIVREYLYATDDLIVQKELQLEIDLPPNIYCVGSKMLMKKVFSNLIGNAIIYSPQGDSVRITAAAHGEQWIFTVENTGTHIPEDAIPHLFDAFYRVDQSRSRETGGSGLGLYIVQKILEQHGSYCVACNTQNGVRFSFTI